MKVPISNFPLSVIWIWVLVNRRIRLRIIFDWFSDHPLVNKLIFISLNFSKSEQRTPHSKPTNMEQRAEEITEETPIDVSTVSTLLSPLGYGLLSFWMLIVTLLSVFCNCSVIAVMLRNRQLFLPTNVLILGLAVSDLLMTFCGSAVGTVTNYYGQLFMGRELCVFQGFTVNYFGEWLHENYGVFKHDVPVDQSGKSLWTWIFILAIVAVDLDAYPKNIGCKARILPELEANPF